jgi:hypothetical protein
MAAATRRERPAQAPALAGISLLEEFLCRGRKTLIKLRKTSDSLETDAPQSGFHKPLNHRDLWRQSA